MTQTPKDACLDDLKHRILSMDLSPGLSLDEARLAQHYGLSRTPLREVLQRLAGAGFVTQEDNKGAKVASMDIARMRVFFQTAPMIYASIGRMAAENATARSLDRVKAAQHDFVSAMHDQDPGAAALANHAFHAEIGAMSSNPYLRAALDRLLIDHTRLSQTFYRTSTAGDAERVATDLALEHWELSRDRIQDFVRPDPLPLDVGTQKEPQNAV